MKEKIFFVLGIILIFGAFLMINQDISGVFGYGFLGLIFLFLSHSFIIEIVTQSKKKIELSKKMDEQLKSIEKTLNEKENELSVLNTEYLQKKDDLMYLKKEIEKLNSYKTNMIYSLESEEKKNNLEYIDHLEGLEFEEYIKQLLIKLNYKNVKKTKASGDFGVDILAEKDGITYAIQCKNYSSPLSNKCIQEAYSGKQYYNCHVGLVVTNSYFTQHAKELAQKNGIILWDRDKLSILLQEIRK